MLAPLERILIDTEAVIKHTRDLTGLRRGIVSIAVLPSIAAGLLPRVLQQAQQELEFENRRDPNLVSARPQGIFSLALDSDLITRSPVRDRHKPRVIRSEKPVWSPEQLRLIVDSVRKDHRSLFQCAMLTGARLGELLGLQWKHVDLETLTLEIRQALWEGELVLPKTEGSVRAIYFGPSLHNAFISQKQNSNHNRLEDFVFCKEDGSPLNPDVLRRDVLYPVLDRLGIPRASRAAGFHTFRHSAATIVNQKTGNLKLVQTLLGHSNLSTTADVYTHTSADANRSAALALDQAIFGDLFQVVPHFGRWNKNAAPN